jgi:hypothetical protein
MGSKSSKLVKNMKRNIIHIQDSLNNTSEYQFKENFVFKDFEIENGVLGLERDIYLSIVKILDSSKLRKVGVNIFYSF